MPPKRMERKIFEAFSRVRTDGENGWLDVEEEEDVDEDEALDEVWTAEDDEEREKKEFLSVEHWQSVE